MLEPPEPNTGLSLVLQNGEASPRDLALALLQAFYSPVYRMANAILGENHAGAAAKRVFVAIIQNSGRYRESADLLQWFYRNALHAFGIKDLNALRRSARDGMDPILETISPASRLPILLHYLCGLDVAQVARVPEPGPGHGRNAATAFCQGFRTRPGKLSRPCQAGEIRCHFIGHLYCQIVCGPLARTSHGPARPGRISRGNYSSGQREHAPPRSGLAGFARLWQWARCS